MPSMAKSFSLSCFVLLSLAASLEARQLPRGRQLVDVEISLGDEDNSWLFRDEFGNELDFNELVTLVIAQQSALFQDIGDGSGSPLIILSNAARLRRLCSKCNSECDGISKAAEKTQCKNDCTAGRCEEAKEAHQIAFEGCKQILQMVLEYRKRLGQSSGQQQDNAKRNQVEPLPYDT